MGARAVPSDPGCDFLADAAEATAHSIQRQRGCHEAGSEKLSVVNGVAQPGLERDPCSIRATRVKLSSCSALIESLAINNALLVRRAGLAARWRKLAELSTLGKQGQATAAGLGAVSDPGAESHLSDAIPPT
jgi:predicted exporter